MTKDVVWNGDKLLQLVGEGLNASLDALALQVVAEAQANIANNGQIDTGAMINSGYAVGPNIDTYVVIGDKPTPPRSAGESEAIAGFAVEYALAQEVRLPYLYPALEKVQTYVPSILKENIPL